MMSAHELEEEDADVELHFMAYTGKPSSCTTILYHQHHYQQISIYMEKMGLVYL
jgi:hypothetical protein